MTVSSDIDEVSAPEQDNAAVSEQIILGEQVSLQPGQPIAEPVFLTEDQVIHINRRLVESNGQAYGLLHPHLLANALARPKQQWDFGEHDVTALAGHLLLAIGMNHPFRAANERTALTAAKIFLHFNGYSLVAPDAEQLSLLVERSISGLIPEAMFLRAMRASAIPTDEWQAFRAQQD